MTLDRKKDNSSGKEILFRAKRIDNGEWVEGYLIKVKKDFYICEYPYECMNEYSSVNGQFYGFGGFKSVDQLTICQYTGLTDKNGRKIFEGDITRDIFDASIVGIVKYGEYQNPFNDDKHGGHVGFYVEWKKKQDLLRKDLVYWVNNSEFVGNIFDNPELR